MNTRKIDLGNGRTREVGQVTCDTVRPNQFKPELGSAQVRVKTVTNYPARNVNNDLFTIDEFGLEAKKYDGSRVAFIDVPQKATQADIQKRLDDLYAAGKFPCIQRIMSLKPMLSDNQKLGIKAGFTTLEKIAEKQRVWKVKMVDGKPVMKADGKPELEPVDFGGKPFYRIHVWLKDWAEDIDTRLAEADDATKAAEAAKTVKTGMTVTSEEVAEATV